MIGFAFLVPDVKYNEAYISFLFTHPEWRGAGIATFMLYHLIQVSARAQAQSRFRIGAAAACLCVDSSNFQD